MAPVTFIIVFIISEIYVRNSASMRKVFYTGSNEKSARYSGIKINKIKILSDAYTTASSAEYPVVLEVTNNHGDVEKLNIVMDVLTSSEYNRQYPALSEYILYVPVGGEVNSEDYIIGIRQGNRMLEFEDTDFDVYDIRISDNVDYGNPGTYNVQFILPYTEKINTETKMIVVVTEDF